MDSNQELSMFARDFLADPVPLSLVEHEKGQGYVGDEGYTFVKTQPVYTADIEKEFSVDQPPSAGLLGDWYETNVDLLDYLTGEEPEVIPARPVEHEKDDQSSRAVQLLANIVEKTSQELDSFQYPAEYAGNTENTKEVDQKLDADTLFKFLSEGIGFNTDVVADAAALSPMSTEDLDEILSSGPSSPDNSFVSEDLPSSSGFPEVSVQQIFYDNSLPQPLESIPDTELPKDIVELLDLITPSIDATYSPSSSFEDDSNDSDYQPSSMATSRGGKIRREKQQSKPYTKKNKGTDKDTIKMERKLRKKQQNKDAATRYRQKKKAENQVIGDECSQLEDRNTELRGKVDQMTKEIKYLKDLLADVYRARTFGKGQAGNSFI